MATNLVDVVASLKKIDNTLKQSAKKGKGAAAEAEAASEAARDAKASVQIQKDILATLKAGVGGATQADKKQGGLISGLLGGLGAGIGAIGKAVSKIGPKFVLGMASLGLGIVAFMVGLGGGAAIAQYAGLDGDGLKTLVGNTFGAFSGTDLIAVGAIIGAAMGLEKFKISKVGVILGMGAIGAGIAAFTLGILLADGFSSIGALLELDGSSLKKLIGNFFGAFEQVGIPGLVTLLTAGALAGAIPGGEIAVVKGMTAIGAGIAGFVIGLKVADFIASLGGGDGSSLKKLLINVGGAIGGFIGAIGKGIFKQLEDLDADKLVQLGKGIAGIGIGIAAFAAGTALGVVGGVMSALGSFFGVDSPIEQIIKISADKRINVKRLKELGEGIGPLGQGLAGFSGLDFGGGMFGGDSLDDFIKMIAKLGGKEINIDATRLKKIGDSIKPLADGIAGFSGLDMEKIVGSDTSGKGSDLQRFFGTLSEKNVSQVASESTMKDAAAGIKPLAEGMKSFAGIDMDALTGGFGEDNLGKFFKGMAQAANRVKEPKKLTEVAVGVKALGDAMQSFKGLDSDKMDFENFFESLEEGDPKRMKKNLDILVEATGGTDRARNLFAQSQQNALGGASGDTFVTNNYYTDNSMKSASSTTYSATEATRQNESTVRALQAGG